MRARPLVLVLSAILGLSVAGQAAAQFSWPVLPFTAKPKNAAPKAPRAKRNQDPVAAAAQAWRPADAENTLVIDTNKGRIIVELVPVAAPAHVERVKTLARRGFYNNRTFFRVIDEFMAQTGDPQDNGMGQSELPNLAPEFTFQRSREVPFASISPGNVAAPVGFVGVLPVKTQPDGMMALMASGRVPAQGLFCPGVIGMARSEAPDTGNSQFFLMRAATPELNGAYTAFGRVISGLDVVRSLKTGEPVPAPQDRMTTVRILADMPAGERPDIQVWRTDTPSFQAMAAAEAAAGGADFDICDLEIGVAVR